MKGSGKWKVERKNKKQRKDKSSIKTVERKNVND